MQTSIFKNNWLTFLGFILILPAATFIIISVLKYGLGIDGPFDAIQPTAERWGIKDPPGFNITSVVAFGPVVAILLTIFQFIKLEWQLSKEEFLFKLSIHKRWLPLLVTLFAIGTLAVLFFYLVGENCKC